MQRQRSGSTDGACSTIDRGIQTRLPARASPVPAADLRVGRPPPGSNPGADHALHQLPHLRRAHLFGGDVVEHRSLPALRARSAAADHDCRRHRCTAPAAAPRGADRVGHNRAEAFAQALGVRARASRAPTPTAVRGRRSDHEASPPTVRLLTDPDLGGLRRRQATDRAAVSTPSTSSRSVDGSDVLDA